MKKNLTKKALVPAIAMVVASVISLSGVTYAWFTTGNYAQVERLNVNVQAAKGIQVSLDAKNWKSNITVKDIIDAVKAGGNIQFPYDVTAESATEIVPVSTAGYVDENGKLMMYKGELNNGKLTATKENEVADFGGNYVAFDLYFKAATEQVLTMEMGGTKSYVKCINAEDGSENSAGTDRAVRVAFLPMGVASTAEAAVAKKDLANGRASLIWEPNPNDRAAGVETPEGFSYKDWCGLNQEFTTATEQDKLVEAGYAEDMPDTFQENKDIMTLKQGINKLRVYIWLEGQDIDCVNEISFGDFVTNLYFTVPTVDDANSSAETSPEA